MTDEEKARELASQLYRGCGTEVANDAECADENFEIILSAFTSIRQDQIKKDAGIAMRFSIPSHSRADAIANAILLQLEQKPDNG